MAKKKMKPEEVLNIKFWHRDLLTDLTIREFMMELLERLWDEGEGFSGKRPFGNSGWEHDVFLALVVNGVIKGEYTIDEEEEEDNFYLESYDEEAAYKVIFDCIDYMKKAPK